MNFRLALSAIAASFAISLSAQTAADAFKSAPVDIFPILEPSTRLDMIDYFNSGMSTPSRNTMSGNSRITELTPTSLTIEMTKASTYQLVVLPGNNIALVTTITTPAPDSKMAIYSPDWANNLTAKTFSKPTLDDWLTPEGKKNKSEVEMNVPFLLIQYNIEPSTGTLTLTNNTSGFLAEEIYQIVEPWLLQSIVFDWNGTKYQRRK